MANKDNLEEKNLLLLPFESTKLSTPPRPHPATLCEVGLCIKGLSSWELVLLRLLLPTAEDTSLDVMHSPFNESCDCGAPGPFCSPDPLRLATLPQGSSWPTCVHALFHCQCLWDVARLWSPVWRTSVVSQMGSDEVRNGSVFSFSSPGHWIHTPCPQKAHLLPSAHTSRGSSRVSFYLLRYHNSASNYGVDHQVGMTRTP